MDASERTIAVAVHGIEPATFERCALIRDWLDDHGVDRVTLLVIPARDLHPLGERSPAMVSWLSERLHTGDSIAQHGFQHAPPRHGRDAKGRLLAHAPGRRSGEFTGLDGEEARRAVHAGWRVLKLAGLEPDGFVAPGYAYTGALREALSRRFRWWADALRIHAGSAGAAGPRPELAPAVRLTGAGRLPRTVPPLLLRAAAVLPTAALRIDIHPDDLAYPRRMLALEWALARSAPDRRAVTYEDLAARALARASSPGGPNGHGGTGGSRGAGRRGPRRPRRRRAQGSTPAAVPAAIIDAER
jgi:predicted deacetylase